MKPRRALGFLDSSLAKRRGGRPTSAQRAWPSRSNPTQMQALRSHGCVPESQPPKHASGAPHA